MPVTDDDGVIVFIAVETRDITQAKAQEREVAQKNVELQGLLERIRELDELKTQFFANVSHELRTPLALILGPAQRCSPRGTTLGAAQRREIARGHRAQRAPAAQARQRPARPVEARRGPLAARLCTTPIRGARAVRGLALRLTRGRAQHRLAVEAPDAVPGRGRRRQAPARGLNLLSQRFKFTPAGGRVRCTLRDATRRAGDRGRRHRPGCASPTCARRSSSASASSTRGTNARASAAPDSASRSPRSSSSCTGPHRGRAMAPEAARASTS